MRSCGGKYPKNAGRSANLIIQLDVHQVAPIICHGEVWLLCACIRPAESDESQCNDRAVADLFDGCYPGQRQKKAKMVGEVGIAAGDRLAACQVLGLECLSVGRENEFGFGSGGRRAVLERDKRLRDLAGGSDGDMDIVGLKDATQVGLVRLALAQALDRRLLVAEGLKEGEGELRAVERLLGERRDGFFDLYGVHTPPRLFVIRLIIARPYGLFALITVVDPSACSSPASFR